jgi:Pregnancy-associated plasma protein-A/Secretion system C-terminal sorting domain
MKNLYIYLLLIAGLVGFGQTPVVKAPCYTDEAYKDLLTKDPSLKERTDRMNESIRSFGTNYQNNSASRSTQTSFTIPVIVYVVHSNQPLGTGSNISDAQVQSQLTALNNYYTGTGFNFCLATKAGSQTLLQAGVNNTTATSITPGIVHVNNTAIANNETNVASQQALLGGTSTVYSTLNQNSYLRIWIVESINGDTTSGIQGYSFLPNTSPNFDGIVMNYRVFGNSSSSTCNCILTANYQQGKILAHEVGHYLGLYHTFEGGCHDTIGINSQIKGDLVVDTPPVDLQNTGCPNNVDSCTSDSLLDDVSNYMDYTYDACKNHFTTGQNDRMLFHLLNFRSSLYNTDNLIFTGVCGSANLVSSNFTGSLDNIGNSYIYNICSGSTMYFKPITASTSYPAGSVITYLWDFGNGLTSTLENATTIYNLSSNTFYNVSLVVTFNGNSSTSNKNIYVNNCAPIVNSESTWYNNYKNILKFNTGVPRTNGEITFPGEGFIPGIDFGDNTFRGISMQNDNNGNVLFFTDGKDVFNGSNPALKINITTLIGGSDMHNQGSLILKSPINNNQYFIINKLVEGQADNFFPQTNVGIRYSVVNIISGIPTMSSNVNVPIVPTATQTIFKTSPLDSAFQGYAAMQAIEKVNGGFWIITSIFATDGKCYLGIFDFSLNGLITLKNTFLLPATTWRLPISNNWYDYLSVSPNGDKITYRCGISKTQILDFDKFEGLISQTTTLNSNIEIFDSIFSPNSKLIYSYYGQMDIDTPIINKNPFSIPLSAFRFIYGIDGKIYYYSNLNFKLSVIHEPNIKVTSSNANPFLNQDDILNQLTISNDPTRSNFPNFIHSKKYTAYDVNQISAYRVGCNSYKFFPDVPTNSATPIFSWNFGDPSSGATNNISALNTPIHVFSASGTYSVSLTYNGSTTITTQVTITTFVPPTIAGSSSNCYNNGVALTNNSVSLLTGQTVVWNVTSGVGTIQTNNQSDVNITWNQLPGSISALVTDSSGCSATITKTITLLPNITPTFNTLPTNICNGSTVPILQTTSNNNITGIWSPNVIDNTTSRSYVFNPNTNYCALPVTITINVLPSSDPSCSSTSCQPNLTLIAPETNTTKNYKYKNWIKTMTNYSISSGKDINMKVEDYLVLAPNTHIMSGSKMLAKIETCVISSSRNSSLSANFNETALLNELKIYPNPTNNIVNIFSKSKKISKIMISSIEGKLIFDQNLINENSFQFDLSNFTDGMYILSIETMDGKAVIKKLIKKQY